MATYKGREVQILGDSGLSDRVKVLTDDGRTITVHKSEVTVYDIKEIPVPVVAEKPMTAEERTLQFYKKATPKEMEREKQRKADKAARDLRYAQYRKDELTDLEIEAAEAKFLADQSAKAKK